MNITDQMLKRAILKSVEAGLLPRRALREEFDDAQEMMRAILQSALGSLSMPEENDAHSEKPLPEQSFASASKRFVSAGLQDIY